MLRRVVPHRAVVKLSRAQLQWARALFLVALLLALVSTMLVPASLHDEAEELLTKAKADTRWLADAVRSHRRRVGQLPLLNDLTTPDAKGVRSLEELPLDPWGRGYVLLERSERRGFFVVSAGPNGTLEDADDVSARAW